MKRPKMILLILVSVLVGVVLLAWLGLQIKPAPFTGYNQQTAELSTVALPKGLPAPVERFYRRLYGERVPVVESAVISGRAKMRFAGITFPGRFCFTHDAGQGYRHYIELTVFGLPLMKVNEYYLNGEGRLELPFGVVENEPKVNQAANLGLWAESGWLPALWVTDPRVRWEAVDEETAVLVVPFNSGEQRLIARFDPATGFMNVMEAMRYKEATSKAKTLWVTESEDWGAINGHRLPRVGRVTWFDEGTPWAVLDIEEVVYNVDVKEYIRAKGF